MKFSLAAIVALAAAAASAAPAGTASCSNANFQFGHQTEVDATIKDIITNFCGSPAGGNPDIDTIFGKDGYSYSAPAGPLQVRIFASSTRNVFTSCADAVAKLATDCAGRSVGFISMNGQYYSISVRESSGFGAWV